MLTGLDRLHCLPTLAASLRTQRVGLLAHPASVDRNMVHISQVLAQLQIVPVRIFGPEHGYGGEAQDMIGVEDALDSSTGAPIVSLYGDSFSDLAPKATQLADLDTLLIDLCDVGSRYYTFIWTAWLAVKMAAEAGVRCVVLDRPNPIGGLASQAEGAIQKQGFASFVGLEPIPVRHGLTIGEILIGLAQQHGIEVGSQGSLQVVGVHDWDRATTAHEWDRPFVAPSPNMPTPDTALVYPGGCLLEGTLMSEGRGTTRPFEWLGAPWLDGAKLEMSLLELNLPGFVPRPMTFSPMFHKHANQVCGGIQVHVTNARTFRPFATYVALIVLAARQHPEAFAWRTERYEFVDDIPAIDLLTGSAFVREATATGTDVLEIVEEASRVDESYASRHRAAVQKARSLAL